MPGQKVCLVVDDSAVIRKLSRRMLEKNGFRVEEAADGQLGLDACRSMQPDVVLLDWNMPVMDGITMLRKLVAEAPTHMPQVLFCTSESEMSRICDALEAGASEYIMKPFDEEILLSKLTQVGVM